jgi:hypothetical protein
VFLFLTCSFPSFAGDPDVFLFLTRSFPSFAGDLDVFTMEQVRKRGLPPLLMFRSRG